MSFTTDPRVRAYREAATSGATGADLITAETGFARYIIETTPEPLRMVGLRVLAREGFSKVALRTAGGLTDDQVAELPPPDVAEHDPISALRAMPYAEYLKTEHWYFTRKLAIARARERCQVCNSPHRLEVHHRTYENRGEERPEDLIVLCDGCHSMFHETRQVAA